MELSFHSTLLVDYAGETKSSYSYVYQVLAEIVDETSPLYRTISGKKYSSGARIGDGVEWVNGIEGATTLSGLNLSTAITSIDEDILLAYGEPENPVSFLGKDYGVSDFSYLIEYELLDGAFLVHSLTMDFNMKGYAGFYGEEFASVHSVSLYSYEPVAVTLPD